MVIKDNKPCHTYRITLFFHFRLELKRCQKFDNVAEKPEVSLADVKSPTVVFILKLNLNVTSDVSKFQPLPIYHDVE